MIFGFLTAGPSDYSQAGKDIATAILMGVVGTYGVVKQHSLNSRAIEVAERGADRADEFFLFTQRQYREISVPTYQCFKDEFTGFHDQYSRLEELFTDLAFSQDEYTTDYVSVEGRVVSTVQQQFDRGRKETTRQLGKYQTGRHKSENLRFALAAALARSDAANTAYRYEEDKESRFDTEYWARRVQAIQAVQNIGSRVFAGLGSGSAAIAQGLGSSNNALQGTFRAAENVSGALAGQSDFFGSLSNGAFQSAGFSQGNGNNSAFGYNGGFGGGFGFGGAGQGRGSELQSGLISNFVDGVFNLASVFG